MTEKAEEIYSFIQERCLWQFHARAWDREEHINNTLKNTIEMLTGKEVTPETDMAKSFHAEAKILVKQLQEKFPWLNEIGEAEIKETIASVNAKLIEVMITKTLNAELTNPAY